MNEKDLRRKSLEVIGDLLNHMNIVNIGPLSSSRGLELPHEWFEKLFCIVEGFQDYLQTH